jgi:hypothetical protein
MPISYKGIDDPGRKTFYEIQKISSLFLFGLILNNGLLCAISQGYVSLIPYSLNKKPGDPSPNFTPGNFN